MRTWAAVESELERIQAALSRSVNRLWKLKLSLKSAYSSRLKNNDFLPRRLIDLHRETQFLVEGHLHELQRLVSERLSAPFFLVGSELEWHSLQNIRRTLRSLKNAYASEASLASSLNRLHKALPRQNSL